MEEHRMKYMKKLLSLVLALALCLTAALLPTQAMAASYTEDTSLQYSNFQDTLGTVYDLEDDTDTPRTLNYDIPRGEATFLIFLDFTNPSADRFFDGVAGESWAKLDQVNIIAVDSGKADKAAVQAFVQAHNQGGAVDKVYYNPDSDAPAYWYQTLHFRPGSLGQINTLDDLISAQSPVPGRLVLPTMFFIQEYDGKKAIQGYSSGSGDFVSYAKECLETRSAIQLNGAQPGVTVTFDANGGTTKTVSLRTMASGYLSYLPEAQRDGYQFDGWWTAPAGGTQITRSDKFTKDTTVYAHWSGITSLGRTGSGGREFPKLSKDEICDLLGGTASASLSTKDLYDVAPNCSAPYSIGKVKQSVLQEATNRLNALRRIAGVPQVTLDTNLCEQGQHGAVLLGKLGSISHTPAKPADMSDSFYQIAKKACNDSNIASSWDVAYVVDDMMDDGGMLNYQTLGHRRWQLNPTMGKIGFGVVKDGKKTEIGGSSAGSGLTYTASATVEMAHDTSGLGCDYDYISWPASGNFPIGQYFHPASSMWSITLNPEKYAAPNKWLVKIKIVRENDGQEWYIDKDSNAKDQSYYFNVDTTNYGVRNCIIFHPSNYVGDYGSSLDGETYTVTVSGLTKADNKTPADDLVYSVNFFNPETYRSSTTSTAPTTPTTPDPKPTTSEEPSATEKPSTTEKPVTSEKPSTSENPTVPTQPTTYSFTDVSSSDYYAKPVTWAVGQGITLGTSSTTFSPNDPCTTAHILTFLWRADGRPGASGANMSWADELVVVRRWAQSKGISVPSNLNTVCTRASAVTYMWKAAGSPTPKTTTVFTDIPTSANYSKAVSWALEMGITNGTSSTTFSPGQGCNRGQIVTFLYREKVEPLAP